MRQWLMSAIPALLLLVGCAHERPASPHPTPPPAAPPPAPPPPAPPPAAPQASLPQPAEGAPQQPTPAPSAETAAGAPTVGGERATAAGSPNAKPKAPGHGESVSAAPHAAAPGKAASSGAADATGARPAPAAAPPLDLSSLEQRLRDTRAIGVFTKLSLKNQVDDLLGEFRSFHRGERTVTLAELRQKYDLLLLKVLSLLQDGDPTLASAISSSREAIWEILIDPQKFQKVARN